MKEEASIREDKDVHKAMKYTILENSEVGPGYGRLVFEGPGKAPAARPGQFYTIRCGEGTAPLLRRPLSVHRLGRGENRSRVEILYRVVGKGTDWLLRRKSGEVLDALGPFGNGFRLTGVDRVVLVAGGIGLAPLFAAGEAVRNRGPEANVTMIIGARHRADLFYEKECREIGEVFVSTEDGSCGFRGTNVDLLADLLEQDRIPRDAAFIACGPNPMMKALADVAFEQGLAVQVSLEEYMCCGFGACLSCAIPLQPGRIRQDEEWPKKHLQWSEDEKAVYALVCKDGPVFDINEVQWDGWLS